jgi:stress response protein SCP2
VTTVLVKATATMSQVKIDLTKVSADVKKLVFAVTIYDAEARKQNFGMVSNSFMRVYNNDNAAEIARFDLSEDASTETAMIFGELYRHGAEWKLKPSARVLQVDYRRWHPSTVLISNNNYILNPGAVTGVFL